MASITELYNHILPTGLPDGQRDAYNLWRRQHVTNRWVADDAPAHLVVRDTAPGRDAFLLLDVSAPDGTALVLKVGHMVTRTRRGRRTTSLVVDDADTLKLAKPTSKPLYTEDDTATLDLVATRGDDIFRTMTESVGRGLREPFFNTVVDLPTSSPQRVTVLSGDTSDPALVVVGWTQGPASSIVTGVQPLMAHSVTTELEAGSAAILTEIGGTAPPDFLRNMEISPRFIENVAASKFDLLARWTLAEGAPLIPGPLSFDPMFEPYLLWKGADPLLDVYLAKLNQLQTAAADDPAMILTTKDSITPLTGRFTIRKRPQGIEITINQTEFRGQSMAPTDITMHWVSPAKPTDPTAFARPAYAAAVHAFWLGLTDTPVVLAVLRVGLPRRVGLRITDFRPPSPGLVNAVLELVGPIVEAPPAVTPVEPSPAQPPVVVVVVPGAPEPVMRLEVIPSRARFLRKGETLRAEKEVGPVLDQLTVTFREDGQVASQLVARNVPLRQANVGRYPQLPYDQYYGIWYRSRAMGYFPKSSTVTVPISIHDSPPSILVRLWGVIEITALDQTHRFRYDLRDNEGLDDAYDVIITLAGDRSFAFGFAKDKPDYAALETISVGKSVVRP